MRATRLPGRINVRVLIILIVTMGVLAGGAAVAYKVRSRIIARRALVAGRAALERRDWVEASKQLRQYLSRHPEDPEMLARYAEANLSIRPLESAHLAAAASAYRMLFRHLGEDSRGPELSRLYVKLSNYNEAVYICRQRLERNPSDSEARLQLARALEAVRKHAEAAQELVTLIREQPSEPRAYALLVDILQQDAAEPMREQIRTLAVRNGKGPANDADLSEELLNLGIEHNPKSALLYAARARHCRVRASEARRRRALQQAKVNWDCSGADLDTADRLPVAEPALHLLLFEELEERGELDRAEVHLKALEQLHLASLREYGIYSLDELRLPKLQCAAILLLKRGQADQASALADRAFKELSPPEWLRFVAWATKLHLAGRNPQGARHGLEQARVILNEQPPGDAETIRDQLILLEAEVEAFMGQPYTVINMLEPVVLRHPNSSGAARLLAHAYLQTGQPRRAAQVAQGSAELLSEMSETSDQFLSTKLLKSCIMQGRWREAQQLAQSLKGTASDNLDLQLLLLQTEMSAPQGSAPSKEQISDWSARLSRMAKDLPRSVEVRTLQAGLELLAGRPDEAIARLERGIQECENPLQARLMLAALYARRKSDLAKATEVCAVAVEKHPDRSAARLALSELQNAAGHKEQARATLEQAVGELSGTDKADATAALAVLLITTGDSAKAVDLLEHQARENPQDLRSRLLLLETVEKQSEPAARQKLIDEIRAVEGERGLKWRVEQAAADLQRVAGTIKAPPEMVAARESQIVALLRYCIEADSVWSEPAVILGDMYRHLGKQEEAEQAYRRLLDANQGDLAVMDRLLALLRARGRFVEADDVLKKIPQGLLRTSDRLMKHQVDVALTVGDTSRAVATLDEIVSTRPQEATSRILLARALLLQRGDLDRAMRLLDEAEALSPGLFETLSARVAILHARGQDAPAAAVLDQQVEERKDFRSFLLRAQFRVTTRQFERAEQDFVRLTELSEFVPRGHELLGRFHQSRGATDKAIAAWEGGLKVAPDDERLRLVLTQALLKQPAKEFRQRGLTLLDESLTRTPDHPGFLTLRALTSTGEQATQATDRAIAALQRLLATDSRNVSAHFNLLELTRRKGDPAEIRKRLSHALGSNPGNSDLLRLAADIEQQLENPAAARAYAQAALDLDPSHVPTRNLLVRLALAAGDLPSAESHSREVLKLAPDDEAANVAAAMLLRARGRVDEAIRYLETFRSTDIGRGSVDVVLHLAILYMETKEIAKAAAQIDEAGKLAPDNLAVLRAQFRYLAVCGKQEELLALVKQRAEKSPDPATILFAGGVALSGTGKEPSLREAIRLFQRILELDPKHLNAHTALGDTAYRVKDYPLAITGYQGMLKVSPDDPGGLNSLAWTLGVMLNKPEEAIQYADRAVAVRPADPHLLDTRGALLLKLGRFEEARGDLQKCLASRQLSPDTKLSALRSLGQVLAKLNQPASARERIAEALQLDQAIHVLADGERAELETLLKSLKQ